MKVALYVRVSTNGKGQDVEMQLRDLRSNAQARQMDIFKEYIDSGISGRRDKRPSLDLLMNDARKKRFDVVMVWRFDRFARSTKHLVTALEEFKHLGIDFISYQENIDTSSPMGKAMFTIVSAISELEADIIRERVCGGLRNARAKGKKLGRPNKEISVDTMIDLREQGYTFRKIAEVMGVSHTLVNKTLMNLPCKNVVNSMAA